MLDTNTLNQEKDALQATVAQSEALTRLERNADFVSVIVNGYINLQAAKQVAQLAQCEKGSTQYTAIITGLEAISQLNAYFNQIHQQGAMAQQSLKELDAISLSEYDYE